MMKLKLPEIKIKKIRLRMTIYYTILIILVILIINFFTCLIFSNELVRQTDNVVQKKMQTITRDLHGKIEKIRTLCSNIQKDDKIIKLAVEDDFENYNESTDRNKNIADSLGRYASTNAQIDRIIMVDTDIKVLDPVYSEAQYRDTIVNDPDFRAFLHSSYFEKFSSSKSFGVDKHGNINNNVQYVSYFNKFWDLRYNRIGYLVVNLDTNNMFNYTEIFCREIFDSAYIVDNAGNLIYKVGTINIGNDIRNFSIANSGSGEIRTINGSKYLVFNKPLSYNTDWRIIGIISYEKLTKNVSVMSLIIYLIGIACIIAVIIVSSYIAKSITNPIIKVNKAISRLDSGEWPEPIVIKSESELKHLADGINKMVKNLQLLFRRIYEEEESKKKAEIRAIQFQLEYLQSQINPHFIYNTLNTISFFALKNGDDKLRELIQSFDMLLRSSISVESDFITIAKELDLTDKYVKIQECRYGKIFEVLYSTPEDILQYKIPKLILQPIVENSLFHGISPKGSKGTIKVEFLKEDACIRVRVIDDGVGIYKFDIPDILSGKRGKYKKGFNNIGLANINERLKLYFGDEYSLTISSNLGIGTTVEFCIPFVS